MGPEMGGHADAVVLPYWPDHLPLEALDVADAAAAAGFGELWVGEMATFDAFALATEIGRRTEGLALVVGPLAVHVRSPAGMVMGAASVAELTGCTVRLALGTSSPVVVQWHGRPRDRAAATLALAAAEVRRLLDGERGSTGFRLRLGVPDPLLTVAASGDRAVDVAARVAGRMVVNLVDVGSAARFRGALDHAADRAGAPVPRLAAWLPAALDPSPEAYRQLAMGLVQYLRAPGYGEQFIAAGFADVVAAARAGASVRELVGDMPPALAEAVGLVGDAASVQARLAAYRDVGVDEVCVVPVTAGDPGGTRTLQALSPATG